LLYKTNNNNPVEICTMFSVGGDKGFRGVAWNTTNYPNSKLTANVGDFIIAECTSMSGSATDVGMGFYLS
jgi:hypothetical protein